MIFSAKREMTWQFKCRFILVLCFFGFEKMSIDLNNLDGFFLTSKLFHFLFGLFFFNVKAKDKHFIESQQYKLVS